jgi:tetratricopeptide (TPR) repeat protein
MSHRPLSQTSTLFGSETASSSVTLNEGVSRALPPRTFDKLLQRGNKLYDDGDFIEAIDHLEQVINALEPTPGSDPKQILETKEKLAMCYSSVGQHEHSLVLHQQILEARVARIAQDGEQLAYRAYMKLGSCHFAQDQYDRAEECYQTALDGLRRHLGAEDPKVLYLWGRLGMIRLYTGRLDEAETILQDVISKFLMRDRECNQLWEAQHSLGILYLVMGRLVEAVGQFRYALSRYTAQLGRGHPFTVDIIYNLAVTLKRQEKFEEAERLYLEVIEGRKRSIGAGHPWTCQVAYDLSTIARREAA